MRKLNAGMSDPTIPIYCSDPPSNKTFAPVFYDPADDGRESVVVWFLARDGKQYKMWMPRDHIESEVPIFRHGFEERYGKILWIWCRGVRYIFPAGRNL